MIAYGKGAPTLAEDLGLFEEVKNEHETRLGITALREELEAARTAQGPDFTVVRLKLTGKIMQLEKKMPDIDKIQKEAVERAQASLDAYFAVYPAAKAWLDWAEAQPFDVGYSLTLLNRKRYYTPVSQMPGIDRSTKEGRKKISMMEASMRNQGKNSPIQGSNADITKDAMIRVANSILWGGYDAMLVNVIHDELLVEVREDQATAVADIVMKEMIAAAAVLVTDVPIEVDPVIADRWEKG
jgi:DNA polymerase I-like protein with 3'-5' exonuclease and polymerase domains